MSCSTDLQTDRINQVTLPVMNPLQTRIIYLRVAMMKKLLGRLFSLS